MWKRYKENGQLEEELNHDEENEKDAIHQETQIVNDLSDYNGLEGIQRYLNERVNIARIFEEVNMQLHKGETVEEIIKKNKNNSFNEEQELIIKRGFYDILQLLGTLNKEENLIKRKEPQLVEEFKKRYGSLEQMPEDSDIILIPLHQNINNILQELIVKS